MAKTKVVFFRGQDAVAAGSGDTIGGFVTVANLMHEVVKNMIDTGFNVVFASKNDTDLNTVSWGTLAAAAGPVLNYTSATAPPKVGAPQVGIPVSDGPSASITLEAGPKINSLNPTSPVVQSAGPPVVYYPVEPWRVKFELLNTECVAAYVATPLQLPGYYAATVSGAPALVAEAWGIPGTHSRLVDDNGTPLDAAGAIGSQQIIPTAQQVISAIMDSATAGTGYAVGDYLVEDEYVEYETDVTVPILPITGLYYPCGGAPVGTGTPPTPYVPPIPLPSRYRAIFRVESVTSTGAIKSLKIIVPGKYKPGVTSASTVGGITTRLRPITGSGTFTAGTTTGGANNGTPRAILKLDTRCSGLDETDIYQGLYNRGNIVGANGASYPLTYELAITNSGFFLGIYESTWATQVGGAATGVSPATVPGRFNWMVVQRPVNRENGTILDSVSSTTSKHPVFCVNGIAGRYYSFVVREKDIAHPTAGPQDHSTIAYYDDTGNTAGTLLSRYTSTGSQPYANYSYRVPAVLNSEDSHLLFNPENQISLTEDKKYLVSFPHNLTTPRFRYTEELDLIGLTSADVLMAGQLISINTYGEKDGSGNLRPRKYLALPPSGQYNTGLRICVVQETDGTAL